MCGSIFIPFSKLFLGQVGDIQVFSILAPPGSPDSLKFWTFHCCMNLCHGEKQNTKNNLLGPTFYFCPMIQKRRTPMGHTFFSATHEGPFSGRSARILFQAPIPSYASDLDELIWIPRTRWHSRPLAGDLGQICALHPRVTLLGPPVVSFLTNFFVWEGVLYENRPQTKVGTLTICF